MSNKSFVCGTIIQTMKVRLWRQHPMPSDGDMPYTTWNAAHVHLSCNSSTCFHVKVMHWQKTTQQALSLTSCLLNMFVKRKYQRQRCTFTVSLQYVKATITITHSYSRWVGKWLQPGLGWPTNLLFFRPQAHLSQAPRDKAPCIRTRTPWTTGLPNLLWPPEKMCIKNTSR